MNKLNYTVQVGSLSLKPYLLIVFMCVTAVVCILAVSVKRGIFASRKTCCVSINYKNTALNNKWCVSHEKSSAKNVQEVLQQYDMNINDPSCDRKVSSCNFEVDNNNYSQLYSAMSKIGDAMRKQGTDKCFYGCDASTCIASLSRCNDSNPSNMCWVNSDECCRDYMRLDTTITDDTGNSACTVPVV